MLFWLLLLGFAALVAATVVAARLIRRSYKNGNAAAITAYRVENGLPLGDEEPTAEEEDLDAKWAAHWHDIETQRRGTAVWAWVHDDADAWVREHPGWDTDDPKVWAARLTDEEGFTFVTAADTARFDKVEAEFAKKAAYAIDRGVRLWGYASLVDMFAQRLYDRRRSVKKMVALLDKTKTWPIAWQRQLDVLMYEGAVGRAPREKVSTR